MPLTLSELNAELRSLQGFENWLLRHDTGFSICGRANNPHDHPLAEFMRDYLEQTLKLDLGIEFCVVDEDGFQVDSALIPHSPLSYTVWWMIDASRKVDEILLVGEVKATLEKAREVFEK